jgi:hypothetical protein
VQLKRARPLATHSMEADNWPPGQLSHAPIVVRAWHHHEHHQVAGVDPGAVIGAVILAVVGGASFLAVLIVGLVWPVLAPLCLAADTVGGVVIAGVTAAKLHDNACRERSSSTRSCSAYLAAGGAPPGAEPPGGAGRPLDGRNNVSTLLLLSRGSAPCSEGQRALPRRAHDYRA